MSKKLRRAAKALAGVGAAYFGSKMLGSKMDQMKRAKGIGTSMGTDTEFKGKVANLTKKGMKRKMEDAPSGRTFGIDKVVGSPKKALSKKKTFMGMNFGVSQTPSNLKTFKEAEKLRKSKTGFGRNIGRSAPSDAFNITGAKSGKFVTAKCKLGKNKKTKKNKKSKIEFYEKVS